MATRMLINSTRSGQLRVAIVEGTILQEYQVEIAEDGLTRGNIYRGVVANIQPSLNAAFVDLGEERHGFLPVADVLPSQYHKKPPEGVKRPRIDQVLEKGRPIMVQVTKDGVGQKGPALNTNLAIAGRYLVLTPYDGVRGISRKATDDDARKKVRKRLEKLSLPDGHGVIVRTNGLDQNQTTLNRDLSALLRLWRRISTEGKKGRGPKLAYSDQDLIVQALRDYLDPDIEQVIVDNDEVHERAEAYMKAFMPRSKTQLIRYQDRLPLFSRYRLETQIDHVYERSASLPTGGSIVIDQTEALTAIDVNSGRATRTANHDDSIFKINCEAAKEVARQLRLRDIGGLVVVDFIDMRLRKHQNKLERVMRDAMKPDKARWSVGRISSNGLLEINRQRIKQALRLRTHRPCPTCQGVGTTPTPEFAALRLLSRIEARAASGLMKSVTLALHPEIADTLQNRFRGHLAEVEKEHGLQVEIISAPSLARTEERIEWVQREGGAQDTPAPARAAAVQASDLAISGGRRRKKAGADDDEDDAPKSGRRRRRRRRGRGRDDEGGQDETRTETSAEATQADDDDTDSDDEEETPKPRRRSRRRRSRRRRGGDAQETDSASTQDTDDDRDDDDQDDDAAESTAAEAESSDDADDDGDQPRTRRRRSRGRRRRRRGSDDSESAETPETATPEAATSETATSETATSETATRNDTDTSGDDKEDEDTRAASESRDDSDSDDEEPKRRTRRRSRRRRRSTGSDSEASEAEANAAETATASAPDSDSPDDSDSDDESEGTEERDPVRNIAMAWNGYSTKDIPPPPAADSDSPYVADVYADANTEAPAGSDGDPPVDSEPEEADEAEAESQAETDTEEPEKPKRVRRRRRSSRRRTTADPESADESESDNEAKEDQAEAAESTDTESEATEATDEDNPDEAAPAEEAVTEPEAEAAPEPAYDAITFAPIPSPEAEEEDEDEEAEGEATEEETEGEGEEGEAVPTGVLADGHERPSTPRLRWQWWGGPSGKKTEKPVEELPPPGTDSEKDD